MNPLSRSTRRELLKAGALVAFGACADASSAAPLSELTYDQVEISPGPLEKQFNDNHQLLLGLNEDSLLRPFRLRAGLPAPGQELGGWYDTYAFAPAASFGQWLSALARYYAATSDDATLAKLNRLVQGYAATVEPTGKFYEENRFPSYTYDKLVCGLSEAHAFARNPIALDTLLRTTDAAARHLPPKAIPRRETEVLHHEDLTEHCWDESYTLPENLFLAWHRTGETRYRELAKRFLYDDGFFFPLARQENVLPGKHAYSHVNALSSAAQAYLSLGDKRHLLAARNGFAMVQQQSYATGGWGPDEHFFSPGSGTLGKSLLATHNSFETPCGAYAHLKVTRYLLRLTRDSRYGDSLERVLYNTILGAKPVQPDGHAFYYSDYNRQGSKFFHPDKWPCCSGSFPQVTADYRISAYFQGPQGIYVNLYTPSKVTWGQGNKRCSLRQTTLYPYASTVRFTMEPISPETFSVFLRIPEWCTGASVSVNGEIGSREAPAGAFLEIRREWKAGHRIELDLPLSMRIESVDPEHPDTVALLCGPLVLMSLLENTPAKELTRTALIAAKRSPEDSHQWEVSHDYGTLKLRPFADIQDQPYSAYLTV